MELIQQVKGYSDSREEEEEEEAAAAAEIITITGEESSSSRLHHNQDGGSNFMNQRKQLDLMELSLGSSTSNNQKEEEEGSNNLQELGSGSSNSNRKEGAAVEKEHMFDKVVTPSDVGKLNRLVIPKQYAEKYFPLDSSSNEKGLLLNFEDRNGKLWRFRYSYWNSSQSYVMTKGWSRFVKEKKLDAGDIVSFQRGLGELYRHRLYIDWRRRPNNVPDPSTSLMSTPFFLPNHYPLRWGAAAARLYSLPSPPQPPPPTSIMPPYHHHFNNNNNIYTAFHPQQYSSSGGEHLNLGSAGSLYYLRPPPPSMSMSMSMPMPDHQQQDRGNIVPMIIDSVPVSHHNHHHHNHHYAAASPSGTTGKRLRLFGVNMECASSQSGEEEEESKLCLSSSASAENVAMANPPRFGDQKERGVFDLDPSLQYRQ